MVTFWIKQERRLCAKFLHYPLFYLFYGSFGQFRVSNSRFHFFRSNFFLSADCSRKIRPMRRIELWPLKTAVNELAQLKQQICRPSARFGLTSTQIPFNKKRVCEKPRAHSETEKVLPNCPKSIGRGNFWKTFYFLHTRKNDSQANLCLD